MAGRKSRGELPRTLTRYRQAIRDFLDALGPKADGRLESVTQRDIIDFRNGLRDLGKSSSTINLTWQRSSPPRLRWHSSKD